MVRVRALQVLALVLVVVLLPTIGLATPPLEAPTRGLAAAQPASTGLTLARVRPVVAEPGEPVTLSGMLDVAELGIDLTPLPEPTPSATEPPADAETEEAADPPVASVEVRLGTDRIRSHDDVTAWVTDTTGATGTVLARADLRSGAGTDAAQLPFTVTIADLTPAMAGPFGVLPISVEVHVPGRAGPSSALHTFIGYQVRKEYVPLGLSWIVPFTVPTDLLLVGEVGPERAHAWEQLVDTLRKRLTAARDPDTVWIIDPALLTAGPIPAPSGDEGDPTRTGTPTTPSGQPSDATGTGTSTTPEPSGADTDAPAPPLTSAERERVVRAAFAAELLNGAAGRDILLLPRHDADISALPAEADTSPGADALRDTLRPSLDVTAARDLLAEATARVLPTLWPADPIWSAEHASTIDALPEADGPVPWAVLASPASAANRLNGPTATETGGTLLPIEAALSRRASAATESFEPDAIRDSATLTAGLALMADTLITLNDRAGTARHVLIALDREIERPESIPGMGDVLAGVPWLATGPLTTVPGTAQLAEPPDAAATDALAPQPALTAERAQQLSDTLERLPTAASVRIGSGEDLTTRGRDTLAQLGSVRWRSDPGAWSTAYTPLADQVADTFTSLHIAQRDIAFLADSGSMRVTVENSLDDGLHNATLSLVIDHAILRIESGPQPVEIGAASRSTVAFEASAIASGRVNVTAVVRAQDGTYLSEPTTFTVRVSPTSDWIYWALGGVALAVIVVGLARMALRPRPPRD